MRGDARDMRTVEPLLKRADAVIPLAALVGAPLCARDEIGATSLNRDAVVDLAKRVSRDQLVVYPTTNSGYGVGDGNAFCTEESPLRPVSLYGRTKVEAEAAVLEHRQRRLAPPGDGVRHVAAHAARPAGQRLRLARRHRPRRRAVRGAFPPQLHPCARRGEGVSCTRSTTSRRCAASRSMSACRRRTCRKAQLCERIERHVPGFVWLEAPVGEDPDKRDYVVSNEKMEATGWRPDVTLDAGITELVKGYRCCATGNSPMSDRRVSDRLGVPPPGRMLDMAAAAAAAGASNWCSISATSRTAIGWFRPDLPPGEEPAYPLRVGFCQDCTHGADRSHDPEGIDVLRLSLRFGNHEDPAGAFPRNLRPHRRAPMGSARRTSWSISAATTAPG